MVSLNEVKGQIGDKILSDSWLKNHEQSKAYLNAEKCKSLHSHGCTILGLEIPL